MSLNFFSVVVILSLFAGFILFFYFILTQRGKPADNRILALLLLVFEIQILYSFMTSTYAFMYFMNWHKILFLWRQTSLLTGPLFYLYILSFLNKKEITPDLVLPHLVPFTVSGLLLLLYFSRIDSFVIWESRLDLYDTLLILASNCIYLLFSVLILRKEKSGSGGLLLNLRETPHITWLHLLTLGFIALWIMNLNSFALYMILQRPGWCAYTASIYALTAFLFLNGLMLLLLVRPDICYIVIKYRSSRISEEEKQESLEKLTTYMELEKPYLDPGITLESLAAGISVNPRYLSQIINETYRKSFRQYILEYRLTESMRILSDRKTSGLTILEVLYQVGFNSKSTFNNQFKLHTRLTPQEYRERYCS